MSNIKLSVTFELPGSTMMTSQECEENPKENYKSNVIMLAVKKRDQKTKKVFMKNIPIEFKTRKCKTAQQVIKMCDEAYEYMTSVTCPDWFTAANGGPMKWKKFTREQRLQEHLNRICASLGGISYTYAVYGD